MMKLKGMGSKVALVLILATASLWLPLYVSVESARQGNAESVKAVSAQIALLKQQLILPEQVDLGASTERLESYLTKLVGLQERHSANLLKDSRAVLVTAGLSGVIVALLLWLFLRQQCIKPLRQLEAVASQLQSDDMVSSVPLANRADEIGGLARALDGVRAQRLSVQAMHPSAEFSQEERERERQEHTQREQDHERSQARERELEQALEHAQSSAVSEASLLQRIQRLSDAVGTAATGNLKNLGKKLEQESRSDDPLGRMVGALDKLFSQLDRDFVSINTGAGQLAESASQLHGLGESISEGARTNKEKTQNIMAGTLGVRDVLLQVSSSVEQMESGIRGISDNASQASVVATQAVELAQNTDGTMRKLADSSVDINNVIKLITSIAEQTNLLALNATIEAARAGDAGKGFAVVANEVKELAKETNKATDEIQRRISAIRTETGNAVEAIGNINQIVSQIDGLQGNISASVRDQSSAVQTILSLIGNATKDNSTVRVILTEVLDRQHMTQASADEVQRSSEVLRTGAEGNLQITRRYTV